MSKACSKCGTTDRYKDGGCKLCHRTVARLSARRRYAEKRLETMAFAHVGESNDKVLTPTESVVTFAETVAACGEALGGLAQAESILRFDEPAAE